MNFEYSSWFIFLTKLFCQTIDRRIDYYLYDLMDKIWCNLFILKNVAFEFMRNWYELQKLRMRIRNENLFTRFRQKFEYFKKFGPKWSSIVWDNEIISKSCSTYKKKNTRWRIEWRLLNRQRLRFKFSQLDTRDICKYGRRLTVAS